MMNYMITVPYLVWMLTYPLAVLSQAIDSKVIHDTLMYGTKEKCEICRNIYHRFTEGVKKTDKHNFGGGNTNWEEKSLGKFQFSETRLIEIIENLCETSKGGSECFHMVEEHEELIESYWQDEFTKEQPPDLYKWFCIENIKVCCDNGTYGKDCTPCPGGIQSPCSGNGACGGEGTRQGSGKCACSPGYMGDFCNECHTNYYRVVENTTHVECQACDVSCQDSCTEAGPTGCNACKTGYIKQDNQGCIDVNECELESTKCGDTEFCHNTPGSHECKKCDPACQSCKGEGPDNCVECNHGYRRSTNLFCIDINECDAASLCLGPNEKCENTVGSFYCGCVENYIRSNDACIPKPKDETDENSDENLDETTAETTDETPKTLKEDL